MFDPTFASRKKYSPRRGAILPLFALLLPVILVLCGFAINLAYMQLVSTEMKIATDVTAHAAGRAMSESQREIVPGSSKTQRLKKIVEDTYRQIRRSSKWNLVAGQKLKVRTNDKDVHFGYSIPKDGDGLYRFHAKPVGKIEDGTYRASSVGIRTRVNLPLIFQTMSLTKFQPERVSVATQVDRDIALVLDRSGSMLFYKDMADLDETLEDLYEDFITIEEEKTTPWGATYYETKEERRISRSDYLRSLGYYKYYGYWYRGDSLYDRKYSDDLRNEMRAWYYETNEQVHYDMYEYIADWKQYSSKPKPWHSFNITKAPRHSRWSFLVMGVEAFLDVLGGTTDGVTAGTDQKELVALVTFDKTARVDTALTDDDIVNGGIAYYQNIRDKVDEIVPLGGTGIGEGLITGLPPIADPDWAQNNNMSGASSRPFAEKTIVVLTDGKPSPGTASPLTTVQNLVRDNAVTVHTVTFTAGSDKEAMSLVAKAGGGTAYHADTGDVLVEIFEKVANNLPTILTGDEQTDYWEMDGN